MPFKISVKYRCEVSHNGFSLDELKSAIQKYIRRGMLNEAAYCLNEFLSFRNVANKTEHTTDIKRINTNLFHRLLIIAMEDIGPNISGYIKEFDELFNSFRDSLSVQIEPRRGDNFVVGLNLLALLCSLYKSRECSWYKYYWFTDRMVVCKYDLDEQIKNDLKNEDEDLIKLSNELVFSLKNKEDRAVHFAFRLYEIEKTEQSYFRAKDANRLIFFILKTYINIEIDPYFKVYTTELKNCAEKFLCWMIPLLMYLKGSINKDRIDLSLENAIQFVKEHRDVKIEFDEFVYDKHTKKGKFDPIRGSSEYFWLESSKVIPECPLINKKYKDAYCHQNESDCEDVVQVVKETDLLEFKVRAQLLCGNGKTDTYFGVLKSDVYPFKSGELVFVKGPFKDEADVENAFFCNELKKKWGLSSIKMIKIELECDQFEKSEIVFGCRKECKKGWFLLCENLKDIDKTNIPIEIKNSKKYKDTNVLSTKFPIINEENIVGGIGLQYVLLLIFRYYVGIPDVANRNFLIKDDVVYSVDEDVIKKDVNFNMSKAVKEKVRQVCEKYVDKIVECVTRWNLYDTVYKQVEADIKEVKKVIEL